MKTLMVKRVWMGQETAAAVNELTDADWSQVASAPKAVVKFYSPGCPYSRAFAPIYEALAKQYPDVFFAAINVDNSVQKAGESKVQMLPTVVFFANGNPVGRIDGVQDQGDFTSQMNQAFSGGSSSATAAPAAPRAGTLVEPESAASPLLLVGAGAAAVAALGAAAYFIFGKK